MVAPVLRPDVLLAAGAGTVTYLAVGWIVFEGILGPFTSSRTLSIEGFRKSPEGSSLALLAASCASYALLLAILMSPAYANLVTFGDGAVLGATVGVLVALMANTYWHATTHLYKDPAPLLADVGAAGLTVGITGGAVAWVLGYCQEFGPSPFAGGDYSQL